MPKIRRGGRFVLKWDLERDSVMKGSASRRVRKLIVELQAEGLL